MICRHNSEPIEPPAPVTITTRSRMQASNNAGLRRHRIASREIATSTSRISPTFASPVTSCSNSGTVCTCTPSGSSWLKISPAAPAERRQRQQDAIDAAILDERRQLFRREHLDPVHHAAMQALLSSMKTSGSNARVVDNTVDNLAPASPAP